MPCAHVKLLRITLKEEESLFLQSDYANLKVGMQLSAALMPLAQKVAHTMCLLQRLQSKLEAATADMKAKHASRISRYIK